MPLVQSTEPAVVRAAVGDLPPSRTVVDVQVVDRFVSLNLWNDHPAVSRLVESARDEAAEALGRAGYQLSSMRVKPFPDTANRNAAKESAAAAPLPTPAVYAGKPYRGVDYRA